MKPRKVLDAAAAAAYHRNVLIDDVQDAILATVYAANKVAWDSRLPAETHDAVGVSMNAAITALRQAIAQLKEKK